MLLFAYVNIAITALPWVTLLKQPKKTHDTSRKDRDYSVNWGDQILFSHFIKASSPTRKKFQFTYWYLGWLSGISVQLYAPPRNATGFYMFTHVFRPLFVHVAALFLVSAPLGVKFKLG